MTSKQCVVCECVDDSCAPCKNPDECSNCVTCCCSPEHAEWRQEALRKGVVLEYFAVGWMLVEVIGSIAAGIIASSFALIAFGADSLVEITSAIVVLRHLKLDSGGSRAQGERTAMFASILLFALIPVIGLSSTYSFFVLKIQPDTSILGLAIALGAVVIMPILWMKKKQIGERTGCLPLSIDAMESATCFFMSIVLLAGLGLEFLFHVGWFDYAATLLILGFVAIEAKESLEDSRK